MPLLLAFALALPAAAAEGELARFQSLTVESAQTSIYVGTVKLEIPRLTRQGTVFVSTYAARVFPFFFMSESGRIAIDVPDADLRRLEAGETVTFSGQAINESGEPRRIEGRATATNSGHGDIKVRVFVTQSIELIFNTTYTLADASVE